MAGGSIGTAGGAPGTGGAAGPCCAPPSTGGAGGTGGSGRRWRRLGRGGAFGTGGAFGSGGAFGTGGRASRARSTTPGVPVTVGQPVAVAFDGSGGLIVQSREPAMLSLGDGTTITLSTVSRADTGHTLFHANSGGFLACASCHAEGNEDGRTWNFAARGRAARNRCRPGWPAANPSTGTATRPTSRI